MNKTFLKVLLPFLACWIVCNWALRPDRYNQEENRYLASLPAPVIEKFLNGSYGSDLVGYADDRIAARDFWTSFHSSAKV